MNIKPLNFNNFSIRTFKGAPEAREFRKIVRELLDVSDGISVAQYTNKKDLNGSTILSIQERYRILLRKSEIDSVKSDGYIPTAQDKQLLNDVKKKFLELEKTAGFVQNYDFGRGIGHEVDRSLELIDLSF